MHHPFFLAGKDVKSVFAALECGQANNHLISPMSSFGNGKQFLPQFCVKHLSCVPFSFRLVLAKRGRGERERGAKDRGRDG